ncbi:hypothetical protein BJ508DRAFT_411226 [Ascobolus immersus RN42]|uniref:Uncharacterized protein n=1 Tax=Ascobolus immersus RN42 TaxID=1160509 RepID=A0A3N4IP81_ASCIM|nr:hypothetical protein BJ508DRAFT_411226 [Ascobolus immersus RN42]
MADNNSFDPPHAANSTSSLTFLTLPPEIHVQIFTFLTPEYSQPLRGLINLLYALAPHSSRCSNSEPSSETENAKRWTVIQSLPPRSTARVHELYSYLTHFLFAKTLRTQLPNFQPDDEAADEDDISVFWSISTMIKKWVSQTLGDILDFQMKLSDTGDSFNVWLKRKFEVEFWQGVWAAWDDGLTDSEKEMYAKHTEWIERKLEKKVVKRSRTGLMSLMAERRERRQGDGAAQMTD